MPGTQVCRLSALTIVIIPSFSVDLLNHIQGFKNYSAGYPGMVRTNMVSFICSVFISCSKGKDDRFLGSMLSLKWASSPFGGKAH